MTAAALDVTAAAFRRRAALLAATEGRLPEAEAELTTLVDLLADSDLPIGRRALAETLKDRAWVREISNRWDEALSDLDRAVTLTESLPPLVRRITGFAAFAGRAKLRARPGTPVHDLDAASRDTAQARAAGWEGWLADELDCIVATERGEWARAAELSEQVGRGLSAQGFAAGAMFCAVRTTRALLELGRFEAGEDALRPALAFLDQHGPPEQLARALLLSARIESWRGKHEAAWRLVERSLALTESLVRHFRALADQHRFLADKLRHYSQAFAIALAGDGVAGITRAWSIAERAKGFYLCQLVANADVPLFDGVDPGTLQRLREIESELDRIDRQLAQAGPGAEAEALGPQLQRLHAQRDDAYAQAMRDNPHWAALRTPPAVDMATLLPRLHGRYAAFSLFLQPHDCGATLHSFFADDGTPRHRSIELSRDELHELDDCRAKLEQEGANDIDLPAVPHALCARLFPDDLVAALKPERPLLLSAHGVFAALALHATRLADGRRLIECCPVQYVPTFALLGMPSRPRPAQTRDDLLLIGCPQDGFRSDPLPDVREEIQELALLWRARNARVVSVLLDEGDSPAGRGCGVGEWQHARCVHIACHGSFDLQHPLNAALLLGQDKVRAAEFFGVRLSADVVVLSACDVGRRADVLDGVANAFDEWLGLYLPLFYAGAQALVASRWLAESAKAREFMCVMHDALARNLAPAFAFRDACLALASGPPIEVFWANWLLAGIPRLEEPSSATGAHDERSNHA